MTPLIRNWHTLDLIGTLNTTSNFKQAFLVSKKLESYQLFCLCLEQWICSCEKFKVKHIHWLKAPLENFVIKFNPSKFGKWLRGQCECRLLSNPFHRHLNKEIVPWPGIICAILACDDLVHFFAAKLWPNLTNQSQQATVAKFRSTLQA